jgi:hypothetical protein
LKTSFGLVLFTVLFLGSASDLPAQNADSALQDANSAAKTAEDLHAQLQDLKARQASLENRLKQLVEGLKPENIERSLAGIGSTRPEELRALRRSQLNRERSSVLTQLEQLATSRQRLESLVLRADALAYQQSAQGATTPVEQLLVARGAPSRRRQLVMLAGLFALAGLGVLIVIVRRLTTT